MTTATSTTRPKDRKQQIARAASLLFQNRGYHAVSMADIAAEVGITSGALYWHFGSKEELLFHSVVVGLDRLDELMASATDLDDYLRASGELALHRRGLASLWLREARHLPDDRRLVLRRRLVTIAEQLVSLLRPERPDLSEEDAEFLVWTLLAVFASFGVHRITLSQADYLEVHFDLARVVVDCRLETPAVIAHAPSGTERVAFDVELPRRERLIAEATRLFGRRGFNSVSMAEIGAAAGITGSTIYKHFASKQDLLSAVLGRGNERLQAGMAQAMASGANPAEVLEELLVSQVDFALSQRHLLEILISERAELPEKQRRSIELAQRQYGEVWLKLVGAVRPDLEAPVVKIVTDTVFSIINNLVRTRQVARRPDLRDRILEVTTAVLDFPLSGTLGGAEPDGATQRV
ncbi:TetR/AcrR family transcriptional regulator [Microbacterium sp. X-17]|uniref:TetR/AcrR family transcriptional regulator n=1 Tax=Microbacterium sp. X-17 TaxID=3144404 RepID=UPI0031F5B7AD